MSQARQKAAKEQAELLDVLIRSLTAPPGFNAQRVALCGRTLRRKRLQSIKRYVPSLATVEAADLEAAFMQYVMTEHLAMPDGGVSADAKAFVRFLKHKRLLP